MVDQTDTSRTTEQIAERFISDIIDAADAHGPHYAPDFRDCLTDNRNWVETMLAALIQKERADACRT